MLGTAPALTPSQKHAHGGGPMHIHLQLINREKLLTFSGEMHVCGVRAFAG